MPKAASAARGYGRGAAILSVAIGATGSSRSPTSRSPATCCRQDEYGQVALLWSAIFITVSVLYRPVEQLLSRTIADRDVRGVGGSEHLRVAATIQLGLGVLFVVVALLLRQPLQDDLFGGSAALYWILIVAVLAYAASYFARGFLAGNVASASTAGSCSMESARAACSRSPWPSGSRHVSRPSALGMAAAPLVSLTVVALGAGPPAQRERGPAAGWRRPTPCRARRAARGARVHAVARHRVRRSGAR